MKTVREAFERARVDAGEIDRAIAATEAFLAANGGHPVAMAYQGSLHGMKAGASILPWIKLKHVNIATELLDGAYERRLDAGKPASDGEDHPADLEILLLRGVAYASFPPFLGCGAAGRESLDEAIAHPGFSGVPALYRALAYAHLAVLCSRIPAEEDAGRFLERAREADPATAEQVWKAR